MMAENKRNNVLAKIDLAEIAKGSQYEYVTEAGMIVRIALEKLRKLVVVSPGYSPPTNTDLVEWAGLLIKNELDPYSGDCWLIPFRQSKDGPIKWTPVIAEKVRRLRASARKDYEGFEQGWITNDGTRHKAGSECKAKQEEIIGVWGFFYRKGRKPYPHETFCDEYNYGALAKSKKLTHIMKVHRDQGLRLSFPEICTNLYTENELQPELTPAETITPQVPGRDERKQAEGVKIVDTQQSIKLELDKFIAKLLKKIETEYAVQFYPDQKKDREKITEILAEYALRILHAGEPIDITKPPDYSKPESYTLEKIAALHIALNDELPESVVEILPKPLEIKTPEEQLKDAEATAKDKLEDHKYKCEHCGHLFDEATRTNKAGDKYQCPECLRLKAVKLDEVGAEK